MSPFCTDCDMRISIVRSPLPTTPSEKVSLMGQAIVVNPYHQKMSYLSIKSTTFNRQNVNPFTHRRNSFSYLLYIGVGFDTLQFVVYCAKKRQNGAIYLSTTKILIYVRNVVLWNQNIKLRLRGNNSWSGIWSGLNP